MTTTTEQLADWTISRNEWEGMGWPTTIDAESKSGITINIDATDVTIEWDDTADDYFGTYTRRVSVPIVVLRRLIEMADEPDPAQPVTVE